MARKLHGTLVAAAVSLTVGVVAVAPGAADTGNDRACLDARHMALVTNAIHRGVVIDARLVSGCGR
jgi:hypothetical protein